MNPLMDEKTQSPMATTLGQEQTTRANCGQETHMMTVAELQLQLEGFVEECREKAIHGELSSHIPALKAANPLDLGVSIHGATGLVAHAGQWDTPFTFQSVSKVVNFMAACELRGMDTVLGHVGVEPTGDPFDSIIRLEVTKPGKPFNPFINAGAIVVASLLPGVTADEKFSHFLSMLEQLLGFRPEVDNRVFFSEFGTAERNRALAHYLKALGYLEGDVEVALEVYTRQCSVKITTDHLATIGQVLATDGWANHQQIFSTQVARLTKSLMTTCGTYNSSGWMAAFIGVPTKSGISGGMLATVPSRRIHDVHGNPQETPNSAHAVSKLNPFCEGCGIGIYGPAIDIVGNSVAGVALLRKLASQWDLSIF